MKLFALIFSIYLFCLSVLPCTDREECAAMTSDKAISASTDHSNHHEETENCSPFCICACCGQSSNYENIQLSLGHVFSFASKNLLTYHSSAVSEVFFAIWQPPKL